MKDQDEKMSAYPAWIYKHGGHVKDMTMRDHFAGLAMQGMLSEDGGGALDNKELAEFSYWIADAMLKAREK